MKIADPLHLAVHTVPKKVCLLHLINHVDRKLCGNRSNEPLGNYLKGIWVQGLGVVSQKSSSLLA